MASGSAGRRGKSLRAMNSPNAGCPVRPVAWLAAICPAVPVILEPSMRFTKSAFATSWATSAATDSTRASRPVAFCCAAACARPLCARTRNAVAMMTNSTKMAVTKTSVFPRVVVVEFMGYFRGMRSATLSPCDASEHQAQIETHDRGPRPGAGHE